MYEEFIEALQDLHEGGAGAFLLDDLLGEGEDEDDDGETSHGGPTRSKKSGKSGYSQVPQDDPMALEMELVVDDLELDRLRDLRCLQPTPSFSRLCVAGDC